MAFKIRTKENKKYIEFVADTHRLPVYKIKGKLYFLDRRLGEYRSLDEPFEIIKEKDVTLKDLQTPTREDREKFWGND